MTKKAPKKSPKKKIVKKKKTKAQPKDKMVVITSPVSPDVRIAIASEMADDKMIESEMMGEVLPHFVYQFNQDGKTISGLSVKGVSETVRRLNRDTKSGYKIHLKPEFMKVERDVEYNGQKGVEVSVFAEDLITGNSAWGIKFEPYYKTGRNGKYDNTFAVEKALSKAERNAKRKLIPETAAVKMIEKMIAESKGANVVRIEAPKYTQSVVKPAAPKASTPEELYNTITKAIAQAKSVSVVIDIDEKAQQSPKLTQEQKDKIHEAASVKANSIQEK